MTFLATTTSAPVIDLNDPYGAAALLIGALTLVYLLLIRPAKERRKARKDVLSTPPTQVKSRTLSAERSAERAMQSLVLEMEDLARRMGGELDAKSAKLAGLIDEADAAAERLRAAMRSAPADAPVDAVSDAKARADRLLGAVASGKSGREESGLAGLASHRDIYDLADAGEAPDVIARKVKRPAGEVELILALRGS